MSATATDRERTVLEAVPNQLFIGGEWRDASGGDTLGVEDPATGETLVEVADATPADAKAALDAACAVQAEWAKHPPRERGEILRRSFETLMERIDDLALIMTLEMGKPIAESKAEITYAAEFFRWFSEQAVRIEGRFATAPNGQGRLITMKQPVGPCYAITPWNFPMAMGTRKIGPAVAAGCTMVVKPAQQTPLSMLALAQILQECGLPDGVVNIITASSSSAVSKPIIEDPRLRKLTFTGSTPVGIKLVEQSAQGLLKTSMELGGNAPFLVFDDADIDDAVEGALIAKMRNGGEACTSANRFHGAKVLVGGAKPDSRGYFFEPTVLSDISPDSELLREEIFGPVAPVIGFDSEADAIAAANDTEYGLVAYVYTKDVKRAFRVIEGLETGMVGLNQGLVSNAAAPFGGVKHSGFGREGGPEGIEEYLETKSVAMAM
jgi:succinate-semialdehyde dehydrogenase/glutarate-semialdehyde dehydrogenase